MSVAIAPNAICPLSVSPTPVKETVEILPDQVRANPDLYERIGIAEETLSRRTPGKLMEA